MNVFTTDHPLMREPSPRFLRWQRRLVRGFLFLFLGYPAYLLLLGPFSALDDRGVFDFVPVRVRLICYAPTYPIWCVPHLRGRYAGYLNWWNPDPNGPDVETGWD